MEKFWTDERMALCQRMWSVEGRTATDIGKALGCTRNAALSKVHRSGWAQRTSEGKLVRPQTAQRRPRAPKAKPSSSNLRGPIKRPADAATPEAEPGAADALTVFGDGKALLDIEPGECRWPVGDAEFLFCAAPQLDGFPYCRDHARLAYQGGIRRR